MSDMLHVDRLARWAERRKAEATREYNSDGRGDYGDLAGEIQVCDEIIDWCHRGYWSECFVCSAKVDADGKCPNDPEHDER